MSALLTRDSVAACVRRILAQRIPADVGHIREDEPLVGEVLQLNSLAVLSVLVELEDELGVQLTDDVLVGRWFETVRDLIDIVLTGVPDGR
ncbi:acyl carrier protein [Streptomyces sp. NPDC006627]|uniref:acyl carrier protein n=1 Tax=Streptomyces sp. NPDC006627 TaxID=3154679 RepID=UPI0033BAEE2F